MTVFDLATLARRASEEPRWRVGLGCSGKRNRPSQRKTHAAKQTATSAPSRVRQPLRGTSFTEEHGVKCQSCSRPATVHLTDIVNGHKKELHLCESCAEAQQLVKKQELNLPAILQTLIGQHVGPWTDELSRLACPACGIRYMEFRAAGRLGCPHDYNVFRAGLEPLLSRIHRTCRHVG